MTAYDDETRVEYAMNASQAYGAPIGHSAAQIIAGWFKSPSPYGQHISRFAHGMAGIDYEGLLCELRREIATSCPEDQRYLTAVAWHVTSRHLSMLPCA